MTYKPIPGHPGCVINEQGVIRRGPAILRPVHGQITLPTEGGGYTTRDHTQLVAHLQHLFTAPTKASTPGENTMATKTVIEDDLTGGEGAVTVPFSIEGADYQVDLTPANRQRLHSALAPFIAAGRKAPRKRRTLTGTKPDLDLAKVRAWARENSIPVSRRGAIARDVIDRYRKAQETTQNTPEPVTRTFDAPAPAPAAN